MPGDSFPWPLVPHLSPAKSFPSREAWGEEWRTWVLVLTEKSRMQAANHCMSRKSWAGLWILSRFRSRLSIAAKGRVPGSQWPHGPGQVTSCLSFPMGKWEGLLHRVVIRIMWDIMQKWSLIKVYPNIILLLCLFNKFKINTHWPLWGPKHDSRHLGVKEREQGVWRGVQRWVQYILYSLGAEADR